MAFDNFDEGNSDKPLSEINIIPLVDVMLVLLILFIITAPLFIPHSIKIDVPEASSQKISQESENIVLAIDEKGVLFWNDERIDEKELTIPMRKTAKQRPQPELHLRADKKTQYQSLAKIMSMVQNAGIVRLGFITEPVPAR